MNTTPTNIAEIPRVELTDELLISRLRETAKIAIENGTLGPLLAPYAAIAMQVAAARIEALSRSETRQSGSGAMCLTCEGEGVIDDHEWPRRCDACDGSGVEL